MDSDNDVGDLSVNHGHPWYCGPICAHCNVRKCEADGKNFEPASIPVPGLHDPDDDLFGSDCYEVLGVPRNAKENEIDEAYIKRLLKIPYVADYLDRYTNISLTELERDALWENFMHFRHNPERDKTHYDQIMNAYAAIRHCAEKAGGKKHASEQLEDAHYAVLGATRDMSCFQNG